MVWTLASFTFGRALSFATTIVLARLLAPEDFGLVALTALIITTLGLLGDLGLGNVLVIGPAMERRAQQTVFGLTLTVGFATTVLAAATAPVFALAFDEPRLVALLAASALNPLIGAAASFYESLLQRDLRFAARFRCHLMRTLVYTAAAIVLAAAGAGVWSLVVAQSLSVGSYAYLLRKSSDRSIAPALDRAHAPRLLRSGRGFLAQNALAFVELNVDTFAVGRSLGAAELGYYSIAFRIGELPYWAITEPVAKVTFPGFARMRDRGETVTAAYLSVLGLVALIACPLGVLLSATADPFTRVVLGDRWLEAIGPLTVLGVWGTINHVEASLGWLLNSVGMAAESAKVSAVALVGFVPAVLLAAAFGSVTTVAWVALAHNSFSLATRAVVVRRRLELPLALQWRAVRHIALGAAGCWMIARLTVEATAGVAPGVSLFAAVGAGLLAYAGLVTLAAPGVLPAAVGDVRAVVAKRTGVGTA